MTLTIISKQAKPQAAMKTTASIAVSFIAAFALNSAPAHAQQSQAVAQQQGRTQILLAERKEFQAKLKLALTETPAPKDSENHANNIRRLTESIRSIDRELEADSKRPIYVQTYNATPTAQARVALPAAPAKPFSQTIAPVQSEAAIKAQIDNRIELLKLMQAAGEPLEFNNILKFENSPAAQQALKAKQAAASPASETTTAINTSPSALTDKASAGLYKDWDIFRRLEPVKNQ